MASISLPLIFWLCILACQVVLGHGVPETFFQKPPGFHNNCTYPLLIEATADELQDGLQKGCFTSVDLVNAYVARIKEVNSTLHMVLQINPEAWSIAMAMDLERANGTVRGPMHGLPVMIKGNIGTNDMLRTDAGSYALHHTRLPADSTVVAKLREHGLVLLGKTSLTEWANFRSTNSTNGWNADAGQTYGAYFPKQDPNGSSSGSGVGSDLGLFVAALGTETSGSIVDPSSNNNIVGIKPTVGLTSRYLVIPISEHQDTVGPMARTVKDAAKLLQVIAGQDPHDNFTLASPFKNGLPDYAAACKMDGLKGKRIGVASNVLSTWASDEHYTSIIAAFEKAIPVIESAGATIVQNANFTAYNTYLNSLIPDRVLCADFISDIAAYLAELTVNLFHLTDLQQIQNFTWHCPEEDYPYRNTAVWNGCLAAGLNNTQPGFWPLYLENLQIGDEGGILGALKRDNLDAVILPTEFSAGIPALVGSPIITVPLGGMPDNTKIRVSRGLVEAAPGFPFGISFMGAKWSEEELIGMAYAFEQRTMVRGKLQHCIEPHTELTGERLALRQVSWCSQRY